MVIDARRGITYPRSSRNHAQVLLDWPDKEAVEILASLKAALKPGATLLVNEFVIGTQGREMERTKRLLDLNMAANNIPGARLRTVDEHAKLLAKAGLPAAALVPLRSLPSVLRVDVE